MGTHVRTICKELNCKNKALEMQNTLSVVFDPSPGKHVQDWSIDRLFGKDGATVCPLASKSLIYVQHNTDPSSKIQLQPAATSFDEFLQLSTYDLKTFTTPLIIKSTSTPTTNGAKVLPPVVIHRSFTGYGEEFGGFSVDIVNNEDKLLKLHYYNYVPWYLRLFFHTLSFNLNHTKVEYFDVLNNFTFIPAEDHGLPGVIEFSAEIPAKSHLSFAVEFEKAFLHWTEFPPDAHRGFDIGSALVIVPLDCKTEVFNGLEWSPTLYPKKCQTYQPSRLVTETLLVILPTPDFSMPYNVITLTGTVFAMFFGSMYNTLIRRMKNMDKVNDDFVSNRPMAKIFRFIMRLLES